MRTAVILIQLPTGPQDGQNKNTNDDRRAHRPQDDRNLSPLPLPSLTRPIRHLNLQPLRSIRIKSIPRIVQYPTPPITLDLRVLILGTQKLDPVRWVVGQGRESTLRHRGCLLFVPSHGAKYTLLLPLHGPAGDEDEGDDGLARARTGCGSGAVSRWVGRK